MSSRALLRLALLGGSIVAVFAGGLSACGHAADTAPLRLPLITQFVRDPARAPFSDIWAESLVYRGLFQFDGSLNVVPDLAVAMPTISADGRTYTFGISPAARFADGKQVTARDVAYSFTRALSKQERSGQALFALHDILGAEQVHAGYAQALAGFLVDGRQTFTIHIQRPDPGFLDDLALPAASILEQAVASRDDDWSLQGGSAGPFSITSFGSTISLRSNRFYLEGKMTLKGVDLRRVSSASAALRLYRSGELDATPLPESDYARHSSDASFVSSDSQTAYYLALPPNLSRAIRVALAGSIDSSRLAAPGSSLDPVKSLVPQPIVPGYSAIPSPYAYQPSESATILDRPSTPPIFVPGYLRRTPLVRWLHRTIRDVPFTIGTANDVPHDPRVIAASARLPVPGSWLYALGHAEWRMVAGDFGRTLETAGHANVTDGLGPQITLYEKDERLLLQPPLMIPLAVQKQGYLVSSRLQGLTATPLGLEPGDENWTSVSPT